MRAEGVAEGEPCCSSSSRGTAMLVDGVVWDDDNPQVRWQSMPDYLNFGISNPSNKLQHDYGGGGGGRGGLEGQESKYNGPSGGVAAPKVSVTLSDFLQREDSVGSCDFGWFTPSANSLGSLDDLNSAQAGAEMIGDTAVVVGSPTGLIYSNMGMLDCVAAAEGERYGSATNTAALSPSSTVGTASRDACYTSSRQDDLPSHNEDASPSGGATKQARVGVTNPLSNAHGAAAGGTSRGVSALGEGAGSTVAGDVRASLRRRRRTSANRMAEINQWHILHRGVSSTGALSAESEGGGACRLHLRRASYALSTRHFPENTNLRPKPLASLVSRDSSNNQRPVSNSPSPILSGGGRAAALGAGAQQTGSAALGNSPAFSDRAARLADEYKAAVAGDANTKGRGGGLFSVAGGSTTVEQQQPLRKVKPKSYAWALTEIRVVEGSAPWDPPHAEYLVVAGLGHGKLVAGWRRASDFARLAKIARRHWMSKACVSWETLEHARRMDGGGPFNLPWVMRPRRLEPIYLQNKARFLEEFLKQFVFETNSKDALLAFLDPRRRSTVEL